MTQRRDIARVLDFVRTNPSLTMEAKRDKIRKIIDDMQVIVLEEEKVIDHFKDQSSDWRKRVLAKYDEEDALMVLERDRRLRSRRRNGGST